MNPDSGGVGTLPEEKHVEEKKIEPGSTSLLQTIDINTLAQTVATSDRTRAVREQVMPLVTSFLSITSAAQHGKLVLEILEPFATTVSQHLESAQKDLQSRIPAADSVFDQFAAICPVDLKELGWPQKPLEKQLIPALIERSPIGEITGFRAQLVTFRATVDKLHQGDLIGIATDALRGDLHIDEFKTQLAKLFDLLGLVQKAFDFFWGLIKKIGEAVMALFDKVKEVAAKFTQAALAALEEFKKLAALAAEKLSQALAAAEKFFADTVGHAAEVLANTVAILKDNLQEQLAKLKGVLTSSLAEVERVYVMAKQKAEEVLKAAIAQVEALFHQGTAKAESLASSAESQARSLRDNLTAEPRKKLVEGRSKVQQLTAQIESVAQKAKGSMMESVMLQGSAMLQKEVNEITEKVCTPMEATIANAEKQCDEVIARAVECKREALVAAEAEKTRGIQTVNDEYATSLQVIEKTKVDSEAECNRNFEEATRSVQSQFEGSTRDAQDVNSKALAAAESVKQVAREEAEKLHTQTLAAASIVKDEADQKAKSVFGVIDTEMNKVGAKIAECVKNPASALSSHTDNIFVAVLAQLEAAKADAEKASSPMELVEAVKKGGCCNFLFSCFSGTTAVPAAQPESQPLVVKV